MKDGRGGEDDPSPAGAAGRPAADGRLRALMRRRHFVDHEPGALLLWMPADEATRRDLADLLPTAVARHPAARFDVERAGAAVAVRVTAREFELAEIEAEYVADPPLDPRLAAG